VTDGVEEIRAAAEAGDTTEVARLQLEYMEAGTPIVTAYFLIKAFLPILPAEVRPLVFRRLVDTGIEAAAFTVLEAQEEATL
jgi:hypothetical protein